MKKQITHLSVHQVSKVLSFLYFFLTGLVCFPAAILLYLVTHQLEQLALLIVPFIVWLTHYLVFAIMCALYNFTARCVGGIEYFTTEVD